jgi:hypothetical protein
MSSTSPPTASTSPSTASTSPPKRHRKVTYAKAYGYLLGPTVIYKQAIEDGTAIKGQFCNTVRAYRARITKHCGIKYNDIITIRNPEVEPDMPPVYCVVAATNLSKQSKIPRTDIIEKAKEFLGTTEEPKWYYVVKA